MSEQNIEAHRRFVEAFNARGVEEVIALLDPSGEFHSAMGVGGTVYRGHDGMRKYFRDAEDAWGDELRVEPEAYFDLGEQTLLFYSLVGRGRQSGAEVAMPLAKVLRWRDGLCVYLKVYTHREDALRELGVSEDTLERIAP